MNRRKQTKPIRCNLDKGTTLSSSSTITEVINIKSGIKKSSNNETLIQPDLKKFKICNILEDYQIISKLNYKNYFI